ncbi:hypothetical protein N8261_04805 [Flavobacteriaceae bacterium]|nr:hypothetical protein [Flavobacteriaceae bacterium]|tara:strand:+ start:208 stop:546 length:339 start_codon:yes stop_codon:yes gene_type:complete
MYTNEMDNDNNVNVLMNIKESLQKQMELLDYLHDENDHYNKITINTPYNSDNNKYFSNELVEKKIENLTMIKILEKRINSLCIHEIEEDYIETGIESSMMKISFCKKCKITM